MAARPRILAFVMAGGKGTRLEPLTRNRCKPAVPFGGRFRIIDFVLSNLINSGIYSVYVLTQFKSQSLVEHIQEAWSIGGVLRDHFVVPVPAQQKTGEYWYRGTADAIYQNLNLVNDFDPDLVAVFGGDHVFLMDVGHMVDYAHAKKAGVVVACLPYPVNQAHSFGVVRIDESWRITGFDEKPANPQPIPGQPDLALVSMGNYLFEPELLQRTLDEDGERKDSDHDFGKTILPQLLAQGVPVYAYDFRRNAIPGLTEGSNAAYWRDVGTLDSYFEASLDLRAVQPELDLYNSQWPIRTGRSALPPPKFVHNVGERVGTALQSIVCEGTILSGGVVENSLIGRGCRIHSYSHVDQGVVMDYTEIGRGARIRRCIVDKRVVIPANDRIGYDPELDRKRFTVTESGIVVIPKNTVVKLP